MTGSQQTLLLGSDTPAVRRLAEALDTQARYLTGNTLMADGGSCFIT